MEFRRIHPHSSLPSPPSHTHTYTNSIPLDSWSISRDNTTPLFSLCVHRDVLTIPLGSLCVHRDAPSDKPPIKIPRQPFPPIPGSMFYVIYLTRDSTAQCACLPGAGFNPPEFLSPCGLPESCRLATSVVRSRNSKRLVAPPRVYGCIWMDSGSSLAQDLHGSGRHESSIVRPPPRDLGVRGASIVRCGLSCLVDLNSDLYRLCGSLYGLDTFWARGLSWINKDTTTTTTTIPGGIWAKYFSTISQHFQRWAGLTW